jgi:hypothetical protein
MKRWLLLFTWATAATAAENGLMADKDFTSLQASSSAPTWKEYTFGVENLRDGKLDTSWQPKSKKSGVGEWVKITFNGTAEVSAIVISNGFQRNDDLGDLFELNARLKSVHFTFSDGTRESCELEETKREETVCAFSPRTVSSVTVTIDAAHAGKKWQDLAVSELDVRGTVKARTPKPKREWTTAQLAGNWGFHDGTGYELWRNGKGLYDGPRGGEIGWRVEGDVAYITGDEFHVVSAKEMRKFYNGHDEGDDRALYRR